MVHNSTQSSLRESHALPQDDLLLAGEFAYRAIQTHSQEALARAANVLADRDPEELHQMRVSLRRLRVAIATFEPLVELPQAIGDRPTAKIAKALGRVRDLDVLQEWFEQYKQQNKPRPSEIKPLAQLQHRLGKQRKQAMGAIQQLLQGKPYRKWAAGLQDWLEQPTYRAASQFPMAMLLPDLLLPPISQMLLHPGWLVATEGVDGQRIPQAHLSPQALAKVLKREGDDLHGLRKRSKNLRYQVELLQSGLGEDYGDRLKEFKAIQSILGEFQDELVVNQALQQALGQSWPQQLPRLEAHLQQRHQRRWQRWQLLQGQYLDPAFRHGLRQQVINL